MPIKQKTTYQLDDVSGIPHDRRRNARNGGAVAVARKDNRVAGILGHGRLHLAGDHACHRRPCRPEPAVDLAAGADAAHVCQREVEVRNPVGDGAAATESKHDQVVGGVGRHEAGDIAKGRRPVSFRQ